MPRSRRRKPSRNAIVLSDVVFKLGLREITGTVGMASGIPVFICDTENLVSPLSFNPPRESYGQRVTTYIRTYDKSVVLKPACDDVLSTELDVENGEIDVTDPVMLEGMFEEQKLRIIPDVLQAMMYALVASILAVILFLCHCPIFPFVVVPGCISGWCLLWSISNYRHLSNSVVYDSVGNWIDIATGRTSLNGGTFHYRMER